MAIGSQTHESASDDDAEPEPGGGARAQANRGHEPSAAPFVSPRPESPAARAGGDLHSAPSTDEEATTSDPSSDASDDEFEPL